MRAEVAGPQALRLHLLLQRLQVPARVLAVRLEVGGHLGPEQVHRLAFLADECLHPIELLLEFGLNAEIDHLSSPKFLPELVSGRGTIRRMVEGYGRLSGTWRDCAQPR